jgi:OOP family OmpA-OmpF porin
MIARFTLLLAALCLGACAPSTQTWMFGDFDVDKVAALPPEGDAFQQALRKEYVAAARFERDVDYDWGDTDFYLRRALDAGRGTVAPLELSERQVPAGALGDLTAARARLAAALNDGGAEAAPAEAAKAQASYDCWIEQQEEDVQPQNIASCRKQFETAIAEVEDLLKPPPLKSMVVLLEDDAGTVGRVNIRSSGETRTLDQPRLTARLDNVRPRWRQPFELETQTVDARFGRALSVPRELIRRYVLYFEDNSVELTPESEALMPEVIAVVSSFGRKKVTITGHADRFGSEPRNNVIAFQRALELRDMLRTNGVAAQVAPDERGERVPAKRTPDGVKEPANRRVVIDFE